MTRPDPSQVVARLAWALLLAVFAVVGLDLLARAGGPWVLLPLIPAGLGLVLLLLSSVGVR